MDARETDNINLYLELLDILIDSANVSANEVLEYSHIVTSLEGNIENLTNNLLKEDIRYLTHLNNNAFVLLVKTNLPTDMWEELANNVFLSAPSTQIFHFLSEDEKSELFQVDNSQNNYELAVQDAKNDLPGFSTYDFASTDIVLKSFEFAFSEDRKVKLKTNSYGKNYDRLAKELNQFLEGKEISVDENFEQVILKLTSGNKILSPQDLSHGELKKLSIYTWLKYMVMPNSIVLMDEVDIALHPKWQYQMIGDLTKWSDKNQYIIATHSPQILSSTYYKNIIMLKNNGSTTEVHKLNKPPIDRDINAIISTIMDAPDFPLELLVKHKRYRLLVNEGKHETQEGKELKADILEHESENSSFFQDINLELGLM